MNIKLSGTPKIHKREGCYMFCVKSASTIRREALTEEGFPIIHNWISLTGIPLSRKGSFCYLILFVAGTNLICYATQKEKIRSSCKPSPTIFARRNVSIAFAQYTGSGKGIPRAICASLFSSLSLFMQRERPRRDCGIPFPDTVYIGRVEND